MDAKTVGKAPDWYIEYLASDHWKKLRERKLESVGRKCETCGRLARRTPGGFLGGLDVHHLSYERLRNEPLDDLQVLCFQCHAVEHGQPADDRSVAIRRERRAGFEPDEIDLEVESWDKLTEEADLGLA